MKSRRGTHNSSKINGSLLNSLFFEVSMREKNPGFGGRVPHFTRLEPVGVNEKMTFGRDMDLLISFDFLKMCHRTTKSPNKEGS